jgi:hypothetical protein
MEAKVKAKELIREYWDLGAMDIVKSKVCALIAVNEILNLPFEFESERKHWEEVKQEIEKI